VTPYSSPLSSNEVVDRFTKGRADLIEGGFIKLSGGQIVHSYTRLVDRFLGELFLLLGLRAQVNSTKSEGRIAILALGSYGNRELCLDSDIDLMILHEGSLSRAFERALLRMLYSLWDAKLEVGYNIVTPHEAIKLIRQDFGTLTSVISSRLLLGSRILFRAFMDKALSIPEQDKPGMLAKILTQRKRREDKYGSEEYFVEPDLKESPGGLRDFDYIRWIARACFGCERLSEIRAISAFSHLEINKLSYSKGFLLKIRNLLHANTCNKEDRLLVEYQERLAGLLDYPNSHYITAPSHFMKDIYLHMNRIRYVTEEFLTKTSDIFFPSSAEPLLAPDPEEFEVVKGNVVMKGGGSFEDDLMAILRAFKAANEHGLFLGSGFIWEARKKITRERQRMINLPGAKQIFLDLIFNPRNPKILRLALEIGLINAFIPEFRRVRNLAQFGYYHVETVDLHSLRTLEVLNRIRNGEFDTQVPLLRKAWQEVRRPELLFLAALLHDIGKAYGKNHCVQGARKIPRIGERLGLGSDAIKAVTFLVRHHILLARVSQRRDLSDEKTVVSVAQMIRDPDLLRMLYLLTFADSMATGPMARSQWKTLLLNELFLKVNKILEAGRLAAPDTKKIVNTKREELLGKLSKEFAPQELENLFDQVSTRYLLEVPFEDMECHFCMALRMKNQPFAWTLKKIGDAPVTRIIECIHDRPGLFSKMVGVFTINNLKVLSANIFTLKNGLAFNIYEVTNPVDPLTEEVRWKRVKREVLLALKDELAIDDLVKKRRKSLLKRKRISLPFQVKVKVDNNASDFFTIVEVIAQYKPGRLYDVAKVIHAEGLDIRFAKINTDEEKMVGSFYVRDKEGQKIYEEDRLRELIEGLKIVT